MTGPTKPKQNAKKSKQKKENLLETPSAPSAISILKTRIFPLLGAFFVAIAAIVLSGGKKNDELFDQTNNISPKPSDSVSWDPPDPRIAFFLGQACKVAKCHPSLKAVHRSFRAKERIPVGETLFEVPRSMQIWDLDALRDPFIREHLFRASHEMSGNFVGAEAFLAAFLALEINRAKKNHREVDLLRIAYFDTLPTIRELAYHPILTNVTEISEILGLSSYSHRVLEGYRNMIVSEWQAFSVSKEFTSIVSRADYTAARLNVLTRAVRTGPPPPDEVMHSSSFLSEELENLDLLKDELEAYKDLLGLDLMNENVGCIAMVPLADLFNHHPHNHVKFEYQKSPNSSFAVTSDFRTIKEGHEPMVSYGNIADAHLFGRYGFVNGDGSGPTQISIAFHHAVLRLNLTSEYDYLPSSGTTERFKAKQERTVAKYISYDDGYEECIPGPMSHPEQAQLKRLKLQHLLKIANDPGKWIVLMPPRNQDSMPSVNIATQITDFPPHYFRERVIGHYSFDKVQATCRLISLINSDLGGRAIELLTDNLENENFVIGPGNDDLEFRSLMCLGRWFGTALVNMEVKGSVLSVADHVRELNLNKFGSRNWTAFHVRYGEMQALQAAVNLALERVSEKWEDKKYDAPPEYDVRDEECPEEYSEFLFQRREPDFDFKK